MAKKKKKNKECTECYSKEKPTEERLIYDAAARMMSARKTAWVCQDCANIVGVWENAVADGSIEDVMFGNGSLI